LYDDCEHSHIDGALIVTSHTHLLLLAEQSPEYSLVTVMVTYFIGRFIFA